MAAERTSAERRVAPAKPKGGGSTLRVTWIRSAIGHKAAARGTIRALGLHRLNQTIQVADTPAMRGMLRRVAFLVKVEAPGAKEGEAE